MHSRDICVQSQRMDGRIHEHIIPPVTLHWRRYNYEHFRKLQLPIKCIFSRCKCTVAVF